MPTRKAKLVTDKPNLPSKPLKKFRLFPKLPLELRLKIYRVTLVPTIVNLESGLCSPSTQVIAGTCRESRTEYLRLYKILKKRAYDLRPGIKIRINYDIDIVNITHTVLTGWNMAEKPPMLHSLAMVRANFAAWMRPVKFLTVVMSIVDISMWANHLEPWIIFWEQLSMLCPALEVLAFVFGGSAEDKWMTRLDTNIITDHVDHVESEGTTSSKKDICESLERFSTGGLFTNLKLEFKQPVWWVVRA